MGKFRRLRDSPIGGALGAVLALLLGALSWAGIFFPNNPEEKVKWMAVFFFVFAASVAWLLAAYLNEIRKLKDRLTPNLSITLGPRVRPYVQEYIDPKDGPGLRYVRVGIANEGGPVSGVSLTLEQVVDLGDPEAIHRHVYPGHRLGVMDSIRAKNDGSFDVPAGDGKADVAYVDIASGSTSKNAALMIDLAYASQGLSTHIPAGRYRLTLRLDAAESVPVRLDVVLDRGPDGGIRLSEA
jgi:hypothetical protein